MILGSGIFRTKLPIGFSAGGINCGVRLYRPDLGIILSEKPAVSAGVFTRNHCKAASIHYCQSLLPSTKIKAIVTNSGEANAATGLLGVEHNLQMATGLATALGCQPDQVLTASTGVIGIPLSIQKIVEAFPVLIKKVSDIAENFATAILTTDLVPKSVHKIVELSIGNICITGICKGSGMIHPNMATMLGYLLTDAQIDVEYAQMANGMSGVGLEHENDANIFYEALLDVAIALAKSIARDGEGASKLIEAKVSGTQTHDQAKKIAKSIITSPLIKTAMYGESPNWGRIISRIGNEAISEEMLSACVISMQDIRIFAQGAPIHNLDIALLKNN